MISSIKLWRSFYIHNGDSNGSSYNGKAALLFWKGTLHDIRLGDQVRCNSWWCHQMETFSALLALCVGNSPVTGEFPAQRPVTRSFNVFFDLRLNIRLSKQLRGWWSETSSHSSWCHCNAVAFHIIVRRHFYSGKVPCMTSVWETKCDVISHPSPRHLRSYLATWQLACPGCASLSDDAHAIYSHMRSRSCGGFWNEDLSFWFF